MSSFTQSLYQIVFSTKHRHPIMIKSGRDELFKYMTGIIRNNKCNLYQINGVEDHLHIVTHIHPTIALATFVKDVKVASSIFIKQRGLFPGFKEWQVGYGGFTYSQNARENL